MVEFDAVVIGGGHNGLVCGAYLAKAGAKTLVLERRPIVGGACVTEEPWPGFRINTFSYAAGMFRPQIAADLELRRFGLETVVFDPEFTLPLPDGRALTFWQDDQKTAEEIARFSSADARAYPKYQAFWDGVLDMVEPMLLAPPVPLADLAELFRGEEAEALLRDLFLRSAADFLDDWFESDAVKAALSTSGIIGTFSGPYTPGTAYVLAHHKVGRLEGYRKAWGVAKGGMGRIAEAIARSAQHHGATIRTGTGVRNIVVRDGRAVGVETDTGERVEARAVVSTVDAQTTFLRMLPEEALDGEFRRRVARIRSRGCALKFNAALERLPEFRAAPGVPGPHHRGFVDIAPSLDYLERAFDQAQEGRFSERPFMDVVFQSALDPSVAPPGKHTMTGFVQYAPYALSGGRRWDEETKREAGETVLETLEEYAPDIRGCVKASQVVSPVDIERTLGLTGGNIFQGDITPDQIFSFRPLIGWSRYATPVEGLYLGGSAAHPGGGVIGAPGRNVAKMVLEGLSAGVETRLFPALAGAPSGDRPRN